MRTENQRDVKNQSGNQNGNQNGKSQRNGKNHKETKGSRDFKDQREPKDSKDQRDLRDHRESREGIPKGHTLIHAPFEQGHVVPHGMENRDSKSVKEQKRGEKNQAGGEQPRIKIIPLGGLEQIGMNKIGRAHV